MDSARRGSPQIGVLAAALLCVLLVSHLSKATDALALQESSPSSPTSALTPEVPVSPVAAVAKSEQPVERDEPVTSQASRRGESQETTTSQQTASTTVAPEKQSTSDSGSEAKINKDDINTLLASKNDSENDLTSSSAPSAPVKPTSGDTLDTPVDTASQAAVNRVASSVGNRFHYSMSGDSVTDKGSGSEETTTATASDEKDETTTVRPTEEIFELHEDTSKSELKPESKPEPKPEQKPELKPSSSSPAPAEPVSTTTTTTTESNSGSTQIGGAILKFGDASYDEKTDTHRIKVQTKDAEPTNQTSGVESTKKEDASPAIGISSIKIDIPDELFSVKATSSAPTTGAAKEESAEPKQESSSTTASLVATSTATTVKPVEGSTSGKPVDVPSVVAAAVGSAIGSAFGVAVKPMLSRDKSTPAVAAAAATTTTTTTTLKPSSTTTLKSSSDKWNRWSPSTPSVASTSSASSPPPSTRRRPILPSIRRRFRPYNRLNPFPWGVDSYSPGMDGDYMPVDQPQPSSSSSRQPSTSSKPRRRSSTSTTTEAPKSTAGSSRTPSSSDNDADDDASDRPSTSSRRGSEPGRRRHNHHHHHHHHNRNHDHGGSEFGEPGYRRRHYQSSGNGNPNRHFGSRDSDSPFRSPFGGSSADVEPNFSSNPTGFSLFNTGSSGSGFDLLNPFSGWLDGPSNRPSRGQGGPGNGIASGSQGPQAPPSHIGSPSRLPGRQPIPVEGEYDSNLDSGLQRPREPRPHPSHHHHQSGHGRDTHIHVSGGRPPIITTGGGGGGSIHPDREDYDGHHGHHGHDCHDHEYDHEHHEHHREPYRPNRPGRDPYRPYGEDSYSGSRPGRPYNRRDESEVGSSSSNDSSNQDSSGARIRPERERARHEGVSSSESSAASGSPSLLHGSSLQPAAASGPKRIGPSFFSPFESLFGALDDELFNLRSTFIDGSPVGSSGAPMRRPESAGSFLDTIISSPKISMPPAGAVASSIDKLDAKKAAASAGDSEADEAGKTRSFMAVRSFEPDYLAEDTDTAAAGAIATKRQCSGLFRSWPCLSASSSSSLLTNPILEFLSRL